MKIKDDILWQEYVTKNKDAYGACCVRYAQAWAEAMEPLLEAGKTLPEIAQATSNEVDNRPGFGITGFMYGCAVHMLAMCWEHGEELRKWHNGEYGQPEAKGTVNPAILVVGEAT